MPNSSSSALVTDQGTRVSLRLSGHFYQLSQDELRTVLGLPPGPAGVGITVDRDRLCFEFAEDGQTVEVSESDLRRRITKHVKSKV